MTPNPGAPVDFASDTALDSLGAGAYEATITRRWWIVIGPNGGLLAALLLRAAQAEVATRRDDVTPRILTVQYLAPPTEGPVRLDVDVDREGRRVVLATVVMTQGERRICSARVTLATPLGSQHDLADLRMPDVAPPEQCPVLGPGAGRHEARLRWRRRLAVERPGVMGGWLRLEPPSPIDHAVVALMCDNWPPSLRSHIADADLAERTHTTTIELTVYLRAAEIGVAPDQDCLVVLRSASVIDGYHQEDGEVWSADGRLLATSRQLALVFVREG